MVLKATMLPAKVSEHLIFWRFRALCPSGSWSVWLSSRPHFILLLRILCFHCNLHMALFSTAGLYIVSLQRNNKMKCSTNLLLPLTKRRSWGSGSPMLWGFSVCPTHPWHKKFQSSEANCPLSSKKMFNKKTFFKGCFAYFLPCFYQTSGVGVF